ncbi:hypothetical protein [Pedobacter hartonius]|uniref:Uncharacterized protein n=1 Tax=Pedobacter hartonius TaxID=425514 RepID=A0A1H4HER2_9SPHI|nr:hypothetical protein [Pedobacter hartonius]SEB20141.1 hypothetical protein SAMN05443550_11647 [Pedobacter hartonius]
MGLKIAGWQENLITCLKLKGIIAAPVVSGKALLLNFEDSGQLVLNLIPAENNFQPQELPDLQHAYQADGIQLVQLWEDIWMTRPSQVLSRICSMLGKNSPVHGRKTQIISLNQTEADRFFDQYHLQSSATARYKYGLTLDGRLLAAASFSGKRKMTRKQDSYTSVELIRFATTEGITVQGGLSKLIRHLIKTISPNDVMTYTDLDWSYGKGYAKLGFELVDTSAPAEIWLNKKDMSRCFPHRLPEEIKAVLHTLDPSEETAYLNSLQYIRIFNTGNLKYILYL